MTKEIFGKVFGDKGYINKALADLLFDVSRVAAQRGSSTTFNYIFTDLSLFQAIITTESFRLIMKETL
jgi:hypothetical protein